MLSKDISVPQAGGVFVYIEEHSEEIKSPYETPIFYIVNSINS